MNEFDMFTVACSNWKMGTDARWIHTVLGCDTKDTFRSALMTLVRPKWCVRFALIELDTHTQTNRAIVANNLLVVLAFGKKSFLAGECYSVPLGK